MSQNKGNAQKKVNTKKDGNLKNTSKRTAEPMFMGNSEELKQYLRRKMNALISLNAETTDKELESRVCRLIYVCQCVLDLPYFKRGKIKTMPELIEVIKADRADVKKFMDELEPELEEAHQEAEEAFKAAGSYLANTYEDGYNSLEQENARTCIDEFQIKKATYDEAAEEAKIKWWLLGIIHRPVGFFEGPNK